MATVFRTWTALVALSGCHLVGGTDGLYIVEEDVTGQGGASSTSSGGSTTTSTASVGGSDGGSTTTFECTIAEQCPDPEDPCFEPKCTLGDCEFVPADADKLCSFGFCDGAGHCVECLDLEDCDGQVCSDGQCVAGSCQDGEQAGDETDVDCGGSCSPCENNGTCAAPADCKSGICSNTLCVACTMQTECASSHYCDLGASGHCLEKKSAFSGCDHDYECKSNSCDNWFDYCHP